MKRFALLCRALVTASSFVALAGCGSRTPLRAEYADAGAALDVVDVVDVSPPPDAEGFDVVSDACASSSGAIDPLGCVFPDGTRIPFGNSVYRGCVRCLCQESGSLQCLAFDCPSVVTDGGRHGCILPDGRQVDSASWTAVGVTQCYCDLGTFVACRLGPCEDGGTQLSPPPIIGASLTACNSVALTPRQPPGLFFRPDLETRPVEGVVPDGRWVLAGIARRAGAPEPSNTASVIEVGAGVWRVARFTANSTGIERANYEVGPRGELQEVCPQDTRPVRVTRPDGSVVTIGGLPPYMPRYYVIADELILVTDDGRYQFVYRRGI